jgi:Domain of unknown function (DUF4194)/Protein of unknown function (DUF3375)
MERLITDIGQYGTMIEQATAALDEPIDSNVEYRDRQRQMYTDYQAAWDSQGRDSHRAFLRMINDPDQRAEFRRRHRVDHRALPLTRRPRPRNRRPPLDIHRTHHHPRRSSCVKTDQPTTDPDIDFSSLPQVDQAARPPAQRRPRFDGDVSELPDRACWALQHLLTRRYISAEADADVYSWVLEYRKELSVRLSELDLLLRIVDGTDVAFVEQARYESARGIKLLRREPLGTYDSILALHLAQMMRASGGQTVLISREEMHGLFSGVLNDTDRDAVTFAARVDGAIARLAGLEILRKSRDDEDSYLISPVITAIMTASVITELQQQFEQLLNGGAPAEEDVDLD